MGDGLIGSEVDGWRVVARIGQGSMGRVYDVRKGNARAALKVVTPEAAADDGLPRFKREARLLMQVRHPHVVRCLSWGERENSVYLVLEYLPGGSVEQVLDERKRLSVAQAVGLARGVLDGLAAIHEKGIVHRDIKPANLLFDREGRIKVADFGLARRGEASTSLTATGTILGTPYYMAPEQCRGEELDGRADLYAVGVLLYHVLAGDPPYGGHNPLAILQRHMTADVPDVRDAVADAPDQVAEAIGRLMAKEPQDRPADAAAARRLLDGLPEAPVLLARRRRPLKSSAAHAALSSSGARRVLPGSGSQRMPSPGSSSQRMPQPGSTTRPLRASGSQRALPRPGASGAMPAAGRPRPPTGGGPRPSGRPRRPKAAAPSAPAPAPAGPRPLPYVRPNRLLDLVVLLLVVVAALYASGRGWQQVKGEDPLDRAQAWVDGQQGKVRELGPRVVRATRTARGAMDLYLVAWAGVLGALVLDRLLARALRLGPLERLALRLRARRLLLGGEAHAAAKAYEMLGDRARGGELLLERDLPLPAAEMFGAAGLYQRMGDALMVAGKKQEALAAYRLVGTDTAKADAARLGDTSRESAQRLLDEGKVADAIHLHRRAGRHYDAADLLEQEGRAADAIQELEAAYAAGGGRDYWHHTGRKGPAEEGRLALSRRIASLYQREGDRAQAAAYFEKAGDLQVAGDLYAELGDVRGRARCLLAGVPAQGELTLERRQRVEEAAKVLGELGDPAALELFVRVGALGEAAQLARRLGEHAQAADLFARARIPAEAAASAEAAGDLEKAVGLFEEAGDYARAAKLWEQLGQPDEAAEAARNAGDPEGQVRLLLAAERRLAAARVLLDLGRGDEALEIVSAVPADAPDHDDALALAGDVHFKARRYKEAAAAYGKGLPGEVHFSEEVPQVLNYVSALEVLGDLDRALEVLSRLEGKDVAPKDFAQRKARLQAKAKGLSSSSSSASHAAPPAPARPPSPGPSSAAASTGPVTQPGDLVGKVLASYELLRYVGEGSFAWVYEARHTSLGRSAALKLLKPSLASDKAPERFLREGRSLAELKDPHLIQVYDMGEADGLSYIALEFVKGPTLKKLIADEAPFPIPRAARLGAGILAALTAAHAKGVVHRDLKPANILVTRDSQAKVLDFGLARVFDDAAKSATGGYLGTPRYTSPEQAQGEEAGAAADQYAAALVIYEMLTGELPFRSKTSLGYLALHASEAPRPILDVRKNVPAELAAAIMRALEKDPADRWPDVAALAAVVDKYSRRRKTSERARQVP